MTQALNEEFLNLDDIQGNVVRAYGRFSFPCARYFFLNIREAKKGRAFVEAMREKVTTAQRWTDKGEPGVDKPLVTLNIGFTFKGLLKLQLPTRTLRSMPEEYIDGMKKRSHILGDSDSTQMLKDQEHTEHWDQLWRDNRDPAHPDEKKDVHIWISMNAQVEQGTDQPVGALQTQMDALYDLCSEDGVCLLTLNGKSDGPTYQAATAIFKQGPDGKLWPSPTEHFGFADGIGDPVFKGQYPKDKQTDAVIGRGKWMDSAKGWEPLAAGEFILGYPDESQELPPTASPANFMNNGTFMVYRKLHENVKAFDDVISMEAKSYEKVMGVGSEEAEVTLKAKMVGRWPDGVPLSKVPDYPAWRHFRKTKGFDILGRPEAATAPPDELKAAGEKYEAYFRSNEIKDFRFGDDIKGYKCPVGSHLRRTNTRDYLDPLNTPDGDNTTATTQLSKRRRLLRRGLPYGPSVAGPVGPDKNDDTEQGVIFMVICASIFRQFEFVQQQWIQYGLDFNAGNNTCPLLGNHDHHKRYTISSDPKAGKPPYIMSELKTFVEARGGDYFFIPSMTALRMMGMGIVDPT